MEEKISNSKQKRLDREKKEAKKKLEKNIGVVIGIVIALAIVAVIVVLIVNVVKKQASTINPSSDFSAQLDDNGFVKGVKATDYVEGCDYRNIEVPLSEVEYTDEEVEKDIETALSSHMNLNTEDKETAIKDGDKVNIDYVGTIDGEEFEGGNSNGEGSDLTIGLGQFIDDFEQQLIGYKTGENVSVEVTFPEDYQSEELAGKDAVFDVTINGIYEKRDFDDDFVCAYYSDYADTAEGYKQYLKDTNYNDRLREYVTNYLKEKTTLKKTPKKYLKNLEETTYYNDQQSYDYMDQMYKQYYGQGVGTFEDYLGMPESEYFTHLEEASTDSVKYNLACQAVIEGEGITLQEADMKAFMLEQMGGSEENYNEAFSTYGKGFMMRSYVEEKAIDIAVEKAVVK